MLWWALWVSLVVAAPPETLVQEAAAEEQVILQLWDAGDHEGAITRLRALAERLEPHPSRTTEQVRHTLGDLLWSVGEHEAAAQVAAHNLAQARVRGAAREWLETLLEAACRTAGSMGDVSRHRALAEELVGSLETRAAPVADQAEALRLLGSALAMDGDYAQAAARHAAARDAYGSAGDLRQVVLTRVNLAQALQRLGRWEEALAELDLAEAEVEKVWERPDANLADLPNIRANILEEQGDMAGARQAYEQALSRFREAGGQDGAQESMYIYNVASAARAMGDLTASLTGYNEALALAQRSLPPGHPELGYYYLGLFSLNHDIGESHRALEYARQAVAHWETTLGAKHPQTDQAREALAAALAMGGDGEGAVALLGHVLENTIAQFGPAHPFPIRVASTRTTYLVGLGRAAEALQDGAHIYEASRSVGGIDALKLQMAWAEALAAEGHLDEALAAASGARKGLEVATGGASDMLATALAIEAEAHRMRGELRQAAACLRKALSIQRAFLDGLGPTMTDIERRALLASVRELLPELLAVEEDPSLAWDELLRWKGTTRRLLVADRAARLQGSADPAVQEAAQALAQARGALAEATLRALAGDEHAAAEQPALTVAREEAERALLTASASMRALSVDVSGAAVCAALPKNALLVDFFVDTQGQTERFGAFVVDGECSPRRVQLGSRQEVSSAIKAWRQALEAGQVIESRGERLTELLWQPLELPPEASVVLSPIAELAAVPFAALPSRGRFVVEDYTLQVVDDVAALLGDHGPLRVGRRGLVVGAVDFGEKRGEDACSGGAWEALPGAAAETAAVAKLLRARPLTGLDATKEAIVAAAPEATLLHLATHGFFFPTGTCGSVTRDERVLQPGSRSGVVLAGANQQRAGDGLWTAEEVAGLDLPHAPLVVLSACDSGMGALLGDELAGLRRAFDVAGARGLVIATLDVPDEPTAELMRAFYIALRRGLSVPKALRRAQLEALERQRSNGLVDPGAWGAFVATGS